MPSFHGDSRLLKIVLSDIFHRPKLSNFLEANYYMKTISRFRRSVFYNRIKNTEDISTRLPSVEEGSNERTTVTVSCKHHISSSSAEPASIKTLRHSAHDITGAHYEENKTLSTGVHASLSSKPQNNYLEDKYLTSSTCKTIFLPQ